MIEIRFHGRGGQGAVIGGKLLAVALFSEGKFVQAFPSFGVERRGAPVTAFVRLDATRIDLRSEIYHPDHLVILDSTLLAARGTFDGFKKDGWVLINTKHDPAQLQKHPKLAGMRVATVDANAIAVRHRLGSPQAPIVNTAILGAFVRITGLCTIESLDKAIRKGAPIKPEANATAARDAFNEVRLPEGIDLPPVAALAAAPR
jgi:2-oxoisovalerate/pyruvate ferredoxin oxidoreductase gamma subunit